MTRRESVFAHLLSIFGWWLSILLWMGDATSAIDHPPSDKARNHPSYVEPAARRTQTQHTVNHALLQVHATIVLDGLFGDNKIRDTGEFLASQKWILSVDEILASSPSASSWKEHNSTIDQPVVETEALLTFIWLENNPNCSHNCSWKGEATHLFLLPLLPEGYVTSNESGRAFKPFMTLLVALWRQDDNATGR
jgi:hypothetical protein